MDSGANLRKRPLFANDEHDETHSLPRVLYVDDDPSLLKIVWLQQHEYFDLVITNDPEDALRIVQAEDAFCAIVSDLEMPGMDGIEFLRRVERSSPHTSRIMVTANADLDSARRAINEARILRFLTKPCRAEDLREAIQAGVRVYEIAVAERDLLRRTLRGLVEVLTELLAIVNPVVFERASRVRRYIQQLTEELELTDLWPFELAGMLSQLSCMALSSEVVEDGCWSNPLDETEAHLMRSHPAMGRRLIQGISQLETVAEMIGSQDASFNGWRSRPGPPIGASILLGARLLKVALDMDELESSGRTTEEAVTQLRARQDAYDPAVLDALARLTRVQRRQAKR